jgi:hypothetical protein
MKLKGSNKDNLPIVRIDNSLEKFRGKVISKEKLEKANDMLKTTRLPKPRKHN